MRSSAILYCLLFTFHAHQADGSENPIPKPSPSGCRSLIGYGLTQHPFNYDEIRAIALENPDRAEELIRKVEGGQFLAMVNDRLQEIEQRSISNRTEALRRLIFEYLSRHEKGIDGFFGGVISRWPGWWDHIQAVYSPSDPIGRMILRAYSRLTVPPLGTNGSKKIHLVFDSSILLNIKPDPNRTLTRVYRQGSNYVEGDALLQLIDEIVTDEFRLSPSTYRYTVPSLIPLGIPFRVHQSNKGPVRVALPGIYQIPTRDTGYFQNRKWIFDRLEELKVGQPIGGPGTYRPESVYGLAEAAVAAAQLDDEPVVLVTLDKKIAGPLQAYADGVPYEHQVIEGGLLVRSPRSSDLFTLLEISIGSPGVSKFYVLFPIPKLANRVYHRIDYRMRTSTRQLPEAAASPTP